MIDIDSLSDKDLDDAKWAFRQLACIASNMSLERAFLKEGINGTAKVYNDRWKALYKTLPEWAKW